jgi:hypothetical protein
MKIALLKIAFLIASLSMFAPASGQTVTPPKEDTSARDQLKAERARDKAEFEGSSKERPWDRDKNGDRPFERKEAPLPKQ